MAGASADLEIRLLRKAGRRRGAGRRLCRHVLHARRLL